MVMKAHDSYLDLEGGLDNFHKFTSGLKRRNPSVKLLLAIGGWTDSKKNKVRVHVVHVFVSVTNSHLLANNTEIMIPTGRI